MNDEIESEDFVHSKFGKHKKKKYNKKKNFLLFRSIIIIFSASIIFCFGYYTCYLLHYSNNNIKNNYLANNNIINNDIVNNNSTVNNEGVNNFINENNINNNYITSELLNEINKIYNSNIINNSSFKININSIEEEIKKKNNITIINKNIPISSTIHVIFALDENFILETKITIASLLATQKNTTKIVLHIGIVNNFSAKHMLKMYDLKERINNLTEFNFYYLYETMKYVKDYYKRLGPASPGRFEVIKLLPDDIEKVIVFDAGDVLILRDLTEFYHYDLKNYMVIGPPEPFACQDQNNKNNTKYINVGSILLNVKEYKQINFWETFKNSLNIKVNGALDQSLFNHLVPDNKKNYIPFRFGGYTQFQDDFASDHLMFYGFHFERWLRSDLSNSFPEKPKTLFELNTQLYNSAFIHQYVRKWKAGSGLSIYRNLVKYFIRLAGIWDEVCEKIPGYCY